LELESACEYWLVSGMMQLELLRLGVDERRPATFKGATPPEGSRL
jgi:hypothetical protein